MDNWTPLDIGKAPVLKKEVDLALLALHNSISEGDSARRDQILSAFQIRIDELDEFHAQYYSHEFVMLFEKERLRLRKAVQEATSNIPTTHRAPTNSSLRAPSGTPSTKGFAGKSADNSFKKSESYDLGLSERKKTPVKINFGADESSFERGRAAIERGAITVDGNDFVPCEEAGVYVADFEHLDLNHSSDYIDLQIVLNDHELTLLASRLHKLNNPEQSDFKNKLAASSSFHNTPYIDKSRLLKDLYRPVQPDKWTADGDLRPNAKR